VTAPVTLVCASTEYGWPDDGPPETTRLTVGAGGGGVGAIGDAVNVAVTVVGAVTVTVQVPVPVQPPPLQPAKVEPVAGVAVKVTPAPLP